MTCQGASHPSPLTLGLPTTQLYFYLLNRVNKQTAPSERVGGLSGTALALPNAL